MEISKLIDEAGQLKASIKTQQAELTELEEQIKGSLQTCNKVVELGEEYQARLKSRTTISFDGNAIKQKLDKGLFENILKSKTVEVNDLDKFVELLKAKGIKFTEVKDLLNIEYKIDRAKVDKYFDMGLMSLADIENCYTTKIDTYLEVKQRSK